MYILKNAIKSITRSKTRNILICIIICIIAIASCLALCIHNAAKDLRESYRKEYNVTAKFSLNRQSMREDVKEKQLESSEVTVKDFMSEISNIDVETAEKYADSKYVESLTLKLSAGFNSNTLDKVEDTTFSRNIENPEINTNIQQGGNMRFDGKDNSSVMNSSGNFKVVGYNALESMEEFLSSDYKITSGKIFDITASDNSCVISSELAEENSLEVGSEISLVNPYDESQVFTFKLTGIYEDSSESTEFSMFSNSSNQILVSYDSLKNIIKETEANDNTKIIASTEATFNLIGEEVVDEFEAEVKEKGLSDYYEMTTNLNSLEEGLKPLDNLLSFSNTFFILVLSIGGSILVVLNMLNVRERKYEIGVLRAIGMRAGKVLTQFVIELMVLTTISIIVGAIVGSIISVPVANKMLESEIESITTSEEQVSRNFGKGDMPNRTSDNNNSTQMMGRRNMMETFRDNADIDYADKLNAVVDGTVLLELAGIGILLTIVSSSISMIFISRYTPLKILSNRS